MTFRKYKNDSYCVGQKHYSGTKNIVGEITFIKKTGKEIILMVGKRVICKRKKSMIASENTIKAECLGSFFKKLRNNSAKVDKN